MLSRHSSTCSQRHTSLSATRARASYHRTHGGGPWRLSEFLVASPDVLKHSLSYALMSCAASDAAKLAPMLHCKSSHTPAMAMAEVGISFGFPGAASRCCV